MSAQPAPAMMYRHGAAPPCTHAYLTEPVVSLCRAHRLGRVLDVGCGKWNSMIMTARYVPGDTARR